VAVALLGPISVWTTLVLLAAGVASDDRINDGCWGPCATSAREEVLLVGGLLGVIVVPLATILVAVVSALSAEAAKLRNALTALFVVGVLATVGLALLFASAG